MNLYDKLAPIAEEKSKLKYKKYDKYLKKIRKELIRSANHGTLCICMDIPDDVDINYINSELNKDGFKLNKINHDMFAYKNRIRISPIDDRLTKSCGC